MSAALKRVQTAATRHQRVCATEWDRYLAAIRTAREAGHTLDEIGEAVGISKQGVHYLLNGNPRKDQT